MPPNQNQDPYQPQQPGNQNPHPPAPQQPVQPVQGQQPSAVQYPAPPQQPEQNPYDFFMQQPDAAKKPPFGASGSPLQKALFIGGLLIVLLIILAVIMAMASGSKKDTTPLLSVAQSQQEIIRVSGDASKELRSVELQNFAVTSEVSMITAQRELLAHMDKVGGRPENKLLALGKKSQTDQALSAALAANTYDSTFRSSMTSEFQLYATNLQKASAAATTKSERDLLQKQLSEAELLFKQLQE